jgi:hypothetical protein
MGTILIIVLVILLLGGGDCYGYNRSGGRVLSLVLSVLLVV